MKAAYVEKFARFVEWPPESSVMNATSPFVIAVIGKNPFNGQLEKTLSGTKINGKTIQVRSVTAPEEIGDSQILFISKSESAKIPDILSVLGNRPILTIGDTDGYCQKGIMINMYIEDEMIRFEINVEALKKTGIRVSSKVLKLARIVDSK
ncbi:MAG: YfiR family protein [Bacillus subtilis]|nr:YfiR family protein [Bacillus subtilis]